MVNRHDFGEGIDAVFCLLYTSDAADDLLCVDLGGRRIIKKNIQIIIRNNNNNNFFIIYLILNRNVYYFYNFSSLSIEEANILFKSS